MTIEDKIKQAMLTFLRSQGINASQVQDWSEDYNQYTYGGCETCGPEYEEDYCVTIWYTIDEKNRLVNHAYNYSGKFTELIKELDK